MINDISTNHSTTPPHPYSYVISDGWGIDINIDLVIRETKNANIDDCSRAGADIIKAVKITLKQAVKDAKKKHRIKIPTARVDVEGHALAAD